MDDECLIELVRMRRVLYDFKDPRYLNGDLKGRMWQEIGKEMNINGGKCKARWNNIRDNFRKSLGKRRTKSGQAAKKLKPYRFENQLQFLKEYMDERETKGNIGPRPEDEELDDDNEEEETPQPICCLHSSETSNKPANQSSGQENPTFSNDNPSSSAAAFAKPARVSIGKKNTQPQTAASTLMQFLLEKNQEGTKSSSVGPPTVPLDNHVDCFLFGISSTLKSLPPYLQHSAKSEIFSTVQRYELQMLQSKQIDCPRISPPDQNSLPAAVHE